MRQNTKKKRSGFGYFIRMFLLLVELLAVTLFLWGNDAYSISATTPEFKWENYKTIAHALGGIGDKTYLNSKESFLAGYQMGCRLFEVDLVKTSDNVWVCRHSWYQSLGQWEGDEKKVLSSEEFLSRPIYGKYTPITFEDLLVLLSDYPDAFVMLDSKQYSLRNYQKTVDRNYTNSFPRYKFLQRILICNLIPLVHIITTFITVYFFFPPDQSTLSSVYFSGIIATFSH